MRTANKDGRVKQKYIMQSIVAILFVVAISYSAEEFIPGRLQVQKAIFVILAFVGVIGWIYININHIDWKYWMILEWFCIPFIISTFSTIWIVAVEGDEIGVIEQSITTTIFLMVDFFVIIAVSLFFSHNTVKVLSISLIGAYIYTIMLNVKIFGLTSTLGQLLNKEIERNDIGVAVVPLLLFFLYNFFINGKRLKFNWIIVVSLIGVMIFCGKRSAILSLFVGIILIIICKLAGKYSYHVLRVISYFMIILCFFYVIFIHVGVLNQVLENKGTLSDRLSVWKSFDYIYDVSPLYFGKGFGFVHKYMQAGLGNWMVNKYGYLHNSILQLYIETGFWGFCMWLIIYFIVIPYVAIKKFGKSSCKFTIISIISMFAMFTVDNTLTYPLYQICLYGSLYALYSEENEKGKNNGISFKY